MAQRGHPEWKAHYVLDVVLDGKDAVSAWPDSMCVWQWVLGVFGRILGVLAHERFLSHPLLFSPLLALPGPSSNPRPKLHCEYAFGEEIHKLRAVLYLVG